MKDHVSYGAVVNGKMLESNPTVISFTLRESGTKCALQGSWPNNTLIFTVLRPECHFH